MPSSPASDARSEPAVEEAAAEAELARVEDLHKRALADLDNYRKRAAREVEHRVGERSERLLRDWLEVVDSLERALQMQSATDAAAGLRPVMEQMEAILERQGVRRIGEVGDHFDPELYEAVAVVETDEIPDRTVTEVARSGYALGDRVLRPAQVVVSRSMGGNAEQAEEVED